MTTEQLTLPQVNVVVEKDSSSATKQAKSTLQVHSQLAGTLWFAGWLFTIAYAELVWWKAVLALLLWPYFLGLAVH